MSQPDDSRSSSPNPDVPVRSDEPTRPAPGSPADPAASGPDLHQPAIHAALVRYWRANVLIMAVLLTIWAGVGLGCGVLWADWLNNYSIGGFPLGFWFAQQGSIIVFVLIILIYCILLNRLDRQHHDELQQLARQEKG